MSPADVQNLNEFLRSRVVRKPLKYEAEERGSEGSESDEDIGDMLEEINLEDELLEPGLPGGEDVDNIEEMLQDIHLGHVNPETNEPLEDVLERVHLDDHDAGDEGASDDEAILPEEFDDDELVAENQRKKRSKTALRSNANQLARFIDIQRTQVGLNKLRSIAEVCERVRTCGRCNQPQPDFKRVGHFITVKYGKKASDPSATIKHNRYLAPEERTPVSEVELTNNSLHALNAYAMFYTFKRISQMDARLLGIASPVNLLASVLLISPHCTRPTAETSEGEEARGQNDLTTKYKNIISKVTSVKKHAAEFQYHFEYLISQDRPWPLQTYFEKIYLYLSELDIYSLSRNAVHYNEHPRTKRSSDVAVTAKKSVLNKRKKKGQPPSQDEWEMHENALRLVMRHLEFEYRLQQFEFSTMLSNTSRSNVKQSTQPSGAVTRSLRDLMNGKFGLPRGHMIATRRIKSARTVLSGNPHTHMSWMDLPEDIAMELPFREEVTEYNIHRLTAAIRNGPFVHPGAKTVTEITETGEEVTRDLRFWDYKSIITQLGRKVERHMVDGDPFVINRQPSLHRMNILMMFIRVVKDKVMRIALFIIMMLGGDFDGDEATGLALDSWITWAEAYLLLAHRQILSPKNGKPIACFVYDTVIATFLQTLPGTVLTLDDIHQIVGKLNPKAMAPGRTFASIMTAFSDDVREALGDASLSVYEMDEAIADLAVDEPESPVLVRVRACLTSHRLFSMILPADLSFTYTNKKSKSPIATDAADYKITRGELTGTITKSGLHTLLEVITRLYGELTGSIFMMNVQTLANEFLCMKGSSCCIDDFRVDTSFAERLMQQASDYVDHVGPVSPNSLEEEKIQLVLDESQSRAMKQCMLALLKRPGRNGVLEIIKSGTKGDSTTVMETGVRVGQQFTNGSFRLLENIPVFGKKELAVQRAQKAGCITPSYLKGIRPRDVFAGSRPARESQVSTASMVAVVGHFQRHFVKSLEGLHTDGRGYVRTSNGSLASLCYAGDGFNPMYSRVTPLRLLSQSIEEISREHGCQDADVNKEVIGELLRVRNLILRSRAQRHDTSTTVEALGSLQCLQEMLTQEAELVVSERVAWSHLRCFVTETLLPRHRITPICFLATVLETFSPAKVITKRASLASLNAIFKRLDLMHKRALITPFTQVGVLAGQSVGESPTQDKLSSHRVVGKLVEKSGGIQRIREIIKNLVTKSLQSPELQFVVPGTVEDCSRTCKTLTRTLLADVVLTHAEGCACCSEDAGERQLAQFTRVLAGLHTSQIKSTIRFVLDKSRCVSHGLTPMQIATKLAGAIFSKSTKLVTVCPPTKNQQWFLRYEFLGNDETLLEITKQANKLRGKSVAVNAPKRKRKKADTLDELDDPELLAYVLESLRKKMLAYCVSGSSFITSCSATFWKAVDSDLAVHHGLSSADATVTKLRVTTQGSDLAFLLAHPNVDWRTCVSNSITEMAECLGIGATTSWIARELANVLNQSGDAIHHRHIMDVAREMTVTGGVLSYSRFGVIKELDSVLARAAFEVTMPTLVAGAISAEKDPLCGVTENVMVGRRIPVGTARIVTHHVEETLYDYWQLQPVIQANAATIRNRRIKAVRPSPREWEPWRQLLSEARRSPCIHLKERNIGVVADNTFSTERRVSTWVPQNPYWGQYSVEFLKTVGSRRELDELNHSAVDFQFVKLVPLTNLC